MQYVLYRAEIVSNTKTKNLDYFAESLEVKK